VRGGATGCDFQPVCPRQRCSPFAWAWHTARHFSELISWQLARFLRREGFRLTSVAPIRNDFKLRDQLRDAASSVRRNIAEGFGRMSHREFARFLNFAVVSE
jgi:hypothetical protein